MGLSAVNSRSRKSEYGEGAEGGGVLVKGQARGQSWKEGRGEKA